MSHGSRYGIDVVYRRIRLYDGRFLRCCSRRNGRRCSRLVVQYGFSYLSYRLSCLFPCFRKHSCSRVVVVPLLSVIRNPSCRRKGSIGSWNSVVALRLYCWNCGVVCHKEKMLEHCRFIEEEEGESLSVIHVIESRIRIEIHGDIDFISFIEPPVVCSGHERIASTQLSIDAERSYVCPCSRFASVLSIVEVVQVDQPISVKPFFFVADGRIYAVSYDTSLRYSERYCRICTRIDEHSYLKRYEVLSGFRNNQSSVVEKKFFRGFLHSVIEGISHSTVECHTSWSDICLFIGKYRFCSS